MKLPSLEDEGERRIVDKRLRLLATISLLSMIVPILVSSFTVHTTFVIASSSMTPTLMPGDIVTTSLTNGEIANGTIIVFKSSFGGYEAHRVVGESSFGKDVYYSTKGDANNRTDSFLVSGAYIVGPVSRVIPKLGLFFMIPREIVLLATISLVFLYVFLTFKTRDESDKRESTDQLKEDQEQRRKKRIFQTCCVISILVLTNCVTSFASIKLIYCTSQNTASLTSPKVILQNGNAGNSIVYDNGVKADISVQALRWLSDWGYRKSHVINPASGAGTNYQVKVKVYYGSGTDSGENVYLNGKCRTDFGDIRFTNDDQTTLLDYWIEEKVDSSYAIIWVEVADDLSSVSRTIYLYYGKSNATTTSNGSNTFIFFDDFNGPSLDGTKWTQKNGGALTFASSQMTATANGVDPAKIIATGGPTGNNLALRARFKVTGGTNVDERAGLGVKTKTANGKGYNYVLHDFTNLDERSFLDDGVVWNVRAGSWSKNTWYIEEVYHDGAKINGRFDDGSWQSQTWSGRTGYPALNIGSFNGVTVWDWALIRKIVSSEPSHGSWGSEEVVSGTYDYVLRVSNTVTDPWRIRLRMYSDSNVNRLGNCTIYLHNGGTSRQIYINGGSYVQQVGGWYDLAASGTDYIAVSVSASSSETSIIYAYLEVIISNSGVSTLYKITFNIT
jgi:signal peptidase I